MRPLNGKCAMTPEERRARRKELESDPFYRQLINKRVKAWRDANKEKLNAARRAKYAENPDLERARCKAWREANPEKARASWRKWYSKPANVAHLRARDRARAADPVLRARKEAQRKERRKDPAVRARERAYRRYHYHANKYRPSGLRWMFLQQWSKKWASVVADGPEAVDKYLKRCMPRTRSYFKHWQRGGVAALEKLWEVKI